MSLLMLYTVFFTFMTLWRLADSPTFRSPSLNDTIEGVVLWPSEFTTTTGFPPSIVATQLNPVPRSIPITCLFVDICNTVFCCCYFCFVFLFIYIIVYISKDMCSCKAYAKVSKAKRQPVGKSSYLKSRTMRHAKTVPNFSKPITEQNEYSHGM